MLLSSSGATFATLLIHKLSGDATMDLHVDAKSGEDTRLPTGGEILGYLADAFRLKGRFKADDTSVHPKTARRYLNGKQRELPDEKARAVIRQLVDAFVSEQVLRRASVGSPHEARSTIVENVTRVATGWDIIAGELNGYRFPNVDPGLAYLPSLRLAAFSIGISIGAWRFLHDDPLLDGSEEDEGGMCWWMVDDPVKLVFDHYRFDDGGEGPTLDEVAETAGFNLDDVTNWRAGKHRPSAFNLNALAGALAGYSPNSEKDEVLFRLRVAVGVAYIYRKLVELCGEKRIEDLRKGFRLVAFVAHELLEANIDQRDLAERAEVRRLVRMGPSCKLGRDLCGALAQLSGSPFVAQDLIALPGNLIPRLQFWAKLLRQASPQQQIDEIQELLGVALPEETATAMDEVGWELKLRTRDFLEPEGVVLRRILSELNVDPADLQPSTSMLRALGQYAPLIQAEELFSAGDFEGCISLLERAAESDPLNAYVHYKLGAKLNMMMAMRLDQLGIAERAIEACRRAVELKPEWGRAYHELAAVLSNAHRFEEAEKVFAESAHLNEDWHIFHAGRGQNLMWMGRYEAAIESLGRSIELEPEYARAKMTKGACLMALDKKREGKKLLRDVAREGGIDVLTEDKWKTLLDGPVGLETIHPVRRNKER